MNVSSEPDPWRQTCLLDVQGGTQRPDPVLAAELEGTGVLVNAVFYKLVEDIEIAIMTTRRPDGHLESRAMANQKRAAGSDLWFVSSDGTAKLRLAG